MVDHLPGGNAVIWKKSLNVDTQMKVSSDNYLLSELLFNEHKIILANVYMPYDDRTNEIRGEYQQILGDLEASISAFNNHSVICVGDFNADPNRGRLWTLLNDFVANNNFLFFLFSVLPCQLIHLLTLVQRITPQVGWTILSFQET